MKYILAALLAVGTLQNGAIANEKADLFTIVTSADAQTQLMSMVLSMQSVQKGANVSMLLCGPAGDLALKEAPASATTPQKPRRMSPQGLMKKIIESGATVEVCAIYLPNNKGVGEEVLLNGISAAKPPEIAEKLLSPNTRIMSF